ncbi:chloramphenicol phosphotransferase CPT family protein [Kribbella sp. NPDC058245]|uniref:chloramphenicol phosphotransferase CPT family protein n=1 Tax=Kribbella sp. NPDC058245 TaxID=3346399 RepID=UPI0036E7AA88
MITHELMPEAISNRPGRVIVLNGTSSAGKSSIATELLDVLEDVWYHVKIDAFRRMLPHRDWTDEAYLPVLQRTVLGFHRAVAGMAAGGNNVVADYVLGERWRLADALDVLKDVPVLFVGVRCSLPELERRETARGNRRIGQAAMQFPVVHAHGLYDVEVDTERNSPRECALLIRDRLAAGPPTAFDQLRRRQPIDF